MTYRSARASALCACRMAFGPGFIRRMRDTPFTPEQLLEAGYRADRIDNNVANHTAYFKWINEGERRLFMIQVVFWYFGQHFAHAAAQGLGTRVSCEARMYIEAENMLVGDSGFALELSLEPTATIEGLEAFYRNAYDRMGCVPDLLNNGG